MTVQQRIRLIRLSETIRGCPEFESNISISLVPTQKKNSGPVAEAISAQHAATSIQGKARKTISRGILQ